MYLLMNDTNGMAVHVDFNCIFDRAKALDVPFRLTQNIIDGIGVLKTNGTFSKTCELVVETLRAKKQKLVSVLRPFIYDPLLEWKKGGNKTATETTAKLTVNNLIEQATDMSRLAVMFHGWQAFI